MGHRRHQPAGLGGRHKVFGRQLGTVVKLGHVHVQAHRDRALVQVEHFLELGAHDGCSQVALGLLGTGVLELEHGKRVHVEGVGVGRARRGGADVVFARHLAGSRELALGPVTHELESGFLLNHHGGGQVPVAARGSGVGVALDLAEGLQRLLHGVAAQCLGIELDQCVVVKLGTAHTQHHRLKGGEVLPVLATVRHGDQAGFFDFFSSGKELVPSLGCASHTGFFQHGSVGPHPVDAVHIDRCSHVAALVLHDVSHHAGQQAVPFFGLGSGVQIGQHTFRSPFLNGRALDLGGCRRVARDHAAFEHRGCVVTAATGHGKVFPGVVLGLHDFLQLSD